MNIHRGPIHPGMRGPRVEPPMYSMQGSLLSHQLAAQQQAAAQQHAQHQAAQQHAQQQQALAQQQAAAVQQQQMINHRNAMIMNQSRMGGYSTAPSGAASFPNSFLDMRGDQRSQAAAFIRAREYPDRPVSFMGRGSMLDSRPQGIPSRPSPPRPKRPSPSRPHAPIAATRMAEPAGRPVAPLRYGGIGGSTSTQTAGSSPRSATSVRPVSSTESASPHGRPAPDHAARDAKSRRRGGDSSDSDSEVLEGSRKRHRRSSQCTRCTN
jgi:hypothetical protein